MNSNDDSKYRVNLEPYIQRLFDHYCYNTKHITIDWNLMNISSDPHQGTK